MLGTGRLDMFSLSPHPNPPPQGGREPCFSLPPCGGGSGWGGRGGSLVSPSPLVGEGRGGGEGREPRFSLPPCGGGAGWGGGGEGALFLPPPLWGRVGVGGNCAQFNRAQYKLVGGIAR